MKLSPVKKWTVIPMRDDQIPLLGAWIARLDDNRGLDPNLIITQLRGEWQLAGKINYPDYFTGGPAAGPIFFMNGYAPKGQGYHLGTKPIRTDYRLDLLIDPALQDRPGICLRVWHQAVEFLFSQDGIGRVLVDIDSLTSREMEAMRRLGFTRPEPSRSSGGKESYLACRRLDFLTYSRL